MNVGLFVVFDPFGKGILDFAQSGARSDRSYRIDDGLAIRIVLIDGRFLEVETVFEELVPGHPSARPLVCQLERVVAGRQIDAPAAVEVSCNGGRAVAGRRALLGHVPVEELSVHLCGHPGLSETHIDVDEGNDLWLDGLERFDVPLIGGVEQCGALGVFQFLAHVAGEVFVFCLVLLGIGFLVDQVGCDELGNDVCLRSIEETRHQAGVQTAALGQHLEHGGFRIARKFPQRFVRTDRAFGKDVGKTDSGSFGIDVFERRQQRIFGIVLEEFRSADIVERAKVRSIALVVL
jgi:hypothetical protein